MTYDLIVIGSGPGGYSAAVRAGLRLALDAAASDPAVRVVLLTHRGPVFCSGMDLSSAAAAPAGVLVAHEARREYSALLVDLARLGKPVVAAVNGAVAGGGMGVLAACDLAVGADDARFSTPEVDVGLFPYMALAPLVRCIGRREREASPINSLSNGCAERMPDSIRIVDPEFPQSSECEGALKTGPHPSMAISPSDLLIFAPSARIHASVLAQSAPVEKLRKRVVPSAIPASMP